MSTLVPILIFSSLTFFSFLSIVNPRKVNRKANLWFGITILLWSTFWIEEAAKLADWPIVDPNLVNAILFLQFFTPLTLYISIIFFTNPNHKIKKTGLVFLITPLLYGTVLFLQAEISLNTYPLTLGLSLAHSLFYISFSLFKIRKHQKKNQDFSSDTKEIDLEWLKYTIVMILTITIVADILKTTSYYSSLSLYLDYTILITVYSSGYYLIKQKEIFPIDKKQREDVLSINGQDLHINRKRRLFSEEKLVELKSGLNRFMIEKEPYLDNEINLASLSNQLGLSSHQLSFVINNGFDENFFNFVNRHRVEKAKSLLLSNLSDKYSILGIAFESGFNSKTSFNTTFKNFTGQTPSEFKKNSSVL
ncbi:helix-turn-helix domain-containing protein [Flagellimonas algicola]|uniref:AraC family transcriptional regulator n=1 Tax=Flagellimonas algicola TaxID=2583815 RepID=A0ABY2WHI6_9FLAO|nr:helix-turn-helix domain-containing protein [Allomuricauda algicola]TMU50733.1 AraC family transcriptional regulator [Allomuricauda algicola]